MVLYFFDVGANDGATSLSWISKHSENNEEYGVVYAFEPTPRMADIIEAKVQELKLTNYHVIRKAVSNYTGHSSFYVAGLADWGCSSLHKFNDPELLEETWPGREDLKVTEEINVEVTCLSDFLTQEQIPQIDYLHVDAQGDDLQVLMGLKNMISLVKKGCIEMPSSHFKKLYVDQEYVQEDAIKFLNEHGFLVNQVESNDSQCNEVNIYFERMK